MNLISAQLSSRLPDRVKLSTALPWVMVTCGMVLMLIWPLIHTIALRILLVFMGGMIGAWYLIRERFNLYQKPALPLLFIFLLFIWVGIHYLFFARNPGLELGQIKGIWLRVFLAFLLGISTGLFARNNQRAQLLLWAGFSSITVMSFLDYAWVSITRSDWSIPYPCKLGIYDNKISIVFYGIALFALCCGLISYELLRNSKSNGRNILIPTFLIGFTFLAFVLVGTKNGIALGLILISILFAIYFIKASKSFKTNLVAATLIIIIGSMSYLHLRISPEWKNFFPTVAAGVQIDRYPNWQDVITRGDPVLEDGSVASESAYLRSAFATKGLRLLLENPFGYGVVNESFKYLMIESSPGGLGAYPINVTHSGWLDFSLCLGIPGILIVWTAMASAFYFSFVQKTRWAYCGRWILAGSFLVWIFAEVGHTHFVETLFYLIALITAGNLPIVADSRNQAANSVNTARS